MSTGTNKERLEQNNLLLENIKTQVDNLPESEIINNQDITVTENGLYSSDEGYTGLGQVTVQVPQEGGSGDVKLFETVEEMQADPPAKEGDMAVVYRKQMQNWNGEGTITGANFPETVVLPETFTDSAMVMLRSDEGMFDCWGELSPDRFSMSAYSESGSIRVNYTSEDGITYTRTDGGDTYIDFGCEVYNEGAMYGEEWNDALGYFFQTGGMYFEGLYRAENELTHTVNYNYRLENGEVKYDSVEYDFDQLCEDLKFPHLGGTTLKLVSNYAEGKPTRYWSSGYGNQCLIHYNGHIYFGCTCKSSENITKNSYVYYRDVGGSDVFPDISTANLVTINSTKYYIFTTSETVDDISVRYFCDNAGSEHCPMYYISDNTVYNIPIIANTGNYYPQWELAKTQIDATAEYVYGKTFYGKNGVEEGTLTTNVSDSFTDINAEIVCKIQNAYDNMEPRVLTDSDKTIDKNIYFIPAKKDGTPLLDTSSVTNMERMFEYCKSLTTISQLNTSKVTRMNSMFSNCSNLTSIPLLDTSSVTNMAGMFASCKSLTTIPQLDTSRATDMAVMFSNCTSLTTIPQLDTSSAVYMNEMFGNCTNLTSIPQLNTSNAISMTNMFQYCSNLTSIPQLDTSKVTHMNSMFQYCSNLTTIPQLDTSSVTYMYGMFTSCTNLTSIPQLNTSNVTNMAYMFQDCSNLTTIPLLDTSKVTGMAYMFNHCTNLSDESLNNILAMCKNATKITSSSYKTLKYIGLTQAQANVCKTLSNYSSFTSAGWTTGY